MLYLTISIFFRVALSIVLKLNINQSIYMYGAEDSLGVVEVSNFDKTVFEILYPGEILEVPKVFRITSFQNSYLVEVNGVIYI